MAVFAAWLAVAGYVGPAVPVAAQETPPDSDSVTGSGFSDNASGSHAADIDRLANSGVLAGTECAEGLICPDEPLNRWTMAVWLVRILDGVDPEPLGFSRFEDVDLQQWWAPFVERLAGMGVTRGCSTQPALFCPDEPVTRQQMASFLVRAFAITPAPDPGFADVVEGRTHAAAIYALAASGITRGCSTEPLSYCPHAETSRGQMASFLSRAIDHRAAVVAAGVEEEGIGGGGGGGGERRRRRRRRRRRK